MFFLHTFGLRRSKYSEDIEDGGSGFDFSDLFVEVDGHDAFTQKLDAMHFCFNKGSSVVAAAPLLPKGASQVFDGF